MTDRATVRRLPQRGLYDRASIHSILDAGFLAHIGFVVDGQPFVIPTLYGRLREPGDGPDRLYLHGSAASRMMRALAAGIPICVTVTHVDGLVLARSAFHHSMNYRSVVAFGATRIVEDMQGKCEALRVISDHLIAGRWDEVRSPSARELKATTVLEFTIEEASAKIRTGPPADDEEDYALPVWAGVVPFQFHPGQPQTDPRLHEDISLSPSIQRLRARSAPAENGRIP